MNTDKELIKEENKNEEIVISASLNDIDKDIFFTAGMAKKKTTTTLKKRVEVLMLDVYQKINDAISKGLYQCEMQLNREQRSFLSNKGFRIYVKSSNSSGNISVCDVYWN